MDLELETPYQHIFVHSLWLVPLLWKAPNFGFLGELSTASKQELAKHFKPNTVDFRIE